MGGIRVAPRIALAQVFQELLGVLDSMEILYLVRGSVASGSYGIARQTNDIDSVADFRGVDVAAFCEALQPGFYLDAPTA